MAIEVVERKSKEETQALAIIEYREGKNTEYLIYSAEKAEIAPIDVETLKKDIELGTLVSPREIGILAKIQKMNASPTLENGEYGEIEE